MHKPFQILIISFLIFLSHQAFSSEVKSVSSNGRGAILTQSTPLWKNGDAACIRRGANLIGCGKIQKSGQSGAIILLANNTLTPMVGDIAVRSDRSPGSLSTQSQLDSALSLGSRERNRIGFWLSLGDPLGGIVGINGGYNVTDYLRLHVGYGRGKISASSSTTVSGQTTSTEGSVTFSSLGAGARLTVPNWKFSPTLGIAAAYMSASTSVSGTAQNYGRYSGLVNGSILMPYASIGFDLQTGAGFNLQGGYHQPIGSFPGLPFLSVGWFF